MTINSLSYIQRGLFLFSAVALVGSFLYMILILPKKNTLRRLESHQRQLQENYQAGRAHLTQQKNLHDLLNINENQPALLLEKITHDANAHRISIDNTRFSTERSNPLYQMNSLLIHASGHYLPLRQWIKYLFDTHPTLLLTSLMITRTEQREPDPLLHITLSLKLLTRSHT
jgi:Tfp pilus assembly protein PilO